MAERSSRRSKRDHDYSVTTFHVVEEATTGIDDDPAVQDTPITPDGKNPNAVALGRLGGMKGGKARAAKLTRERRQEIARKAAQARWQRRGEIATP